ncbi:pyridoxal phosphate-dependent aminotransferase [Fusobacterium simiae]|uniref:pyridoxal phosphate-dependent aminotransferase n=1 Tax=Fusobacterium TaxID=848 RepID=UPI000416D9B3|nr:MULTISPECIES: pyridoxal phosphate-dependent aminotransferase [Fusobacterium]MDC7954324.1 pyridoxal phosphate-dependent aminotransferase [Fusobacterium simiae]
MKTIEEKFLKLGVENAPGQEGTQKEVKLNLKGEKLEGKLVDFSHGDVDAHKPIPNSLNTFIEGYNKGGVQAYTEYKGANFIREDLAKKLKNFTGIEIDPNKNLIITPGTQGALFLAMGSIVNSGDKVCIVEPDYFANRKLVEFFDGELVPVRLDYLNAKENFAGLDLKELENAFKQGVKLFLFSNPNNPTGVIYSDEEISKIAELAKKYDVTLLVDELYSRQIFDNRSYRHMINENVDREKIITIIGPSKTESLSGFRLGVAFGSEKIVTRMEKLQAIVSLRASGYSQAVIKDWFNEPDGWMQERILNHQEIRDELVKKFRAVKGVEIRVTEGGSYIFPKLPKLEVSLNEFVKILRVHANVIVTPGTEFGPEFTDSIRLNFSQDKNLAMEAVDRIIEMIERYRV